jgi:hypothetical protein
VADEGARTTRSFAPEELLRERQGNGFHAADAARSCNFIYPARLAQSQTAHGICPISLALRIMTCARLVDGSRDHGNLAFLIHYSGSKLLYYAGQGSLQTNVIMPCL